MNTHTINNPFFNRDKLLINKKFSKIIDLQYDEIINDYLKIYCICLKNECTIDDVFYNNEFTFETLKKYIKSLKLIEGNLNMIQNNIHKSSLFVMLKLYSRSDNSL